MNNQLYQIKTYKPKCINKSDGNIIINDLSSGALSFSWLDLPSDAVLTDSGRAVYNLPCGIYTLKIYNIKERSNQTLNIDLSCAEELTIDLIRVDEIKCYNDKINMFIEWSGGLSPYTLQINNENIITTDNDYTYSIEPNHSYNVSIIDNNGCFVNRNNISVSAEKLTAHIRWEPITAYNSTSNKVSCMISGGKPPYKIAWFNQNSDKPLIVNTSSIENKFKSGNYNLTVIDSNGCRFSKDFYISQPNPISVNITSFNDYSTKALYPPEEATPVYNLLLLPENSEITDDTILSASSIQITHHKEKINQKLCMDYGNITIDNKNYRYYYIAPGLPSLQTYKNSSLSIGDYKCELEHKLGSSRPKLIVGSLFMRNDFSFGYKNNDIVCLSSDDKQLNIQIDQPYIKTGLYLSNNIYTIINMINSNSPLADGLLFVNNNKSFTIQSLTTKSNQRLGSIICNVSNGDKNSLVATLINENNDIHEYSFNNNYILNIDNLKYGQYQLIIKDKYSTASIYNGISITNDYYIVNILDSCDTERDITSIQSARIFNIDPKLLNLYNYRPNKLLFHDPEFKNGVLMNISPLDACYEIIGDNINIKDCGYKVLDNLPYGKYTITIFKDGYKTHKTKLFYNSKKDLVTAILQKD